MVVFFFIDYVWFGDEIISCFLLLMEKNDYVYKVKLKIVVFLMFFNVFK